MKVLSDATNDVTALNSCVDTFTMVDIIEFLTIKAKFGSVLIALSLNTFYFVLVGVFLVLQIAYIFTYCCSDTGSPSNLVKDVENQIQMHARDGSQQYDQARNTTQDVTATIPDIDADGDVTKEKSTFGETLDAKELKTIKS